jgi:hypothetical protein
VRRPRRAGDRVTGPTLCQIPNCRIRGRHKPTCGTCPVECDCHNGPHYPCSVPGGCGSEGCGRAEDCTGCLPRLATEGLCCDTHVRWAAESLAEIIALTDDARAVAAGLVRHGSGGGGKPGSRSPGNDDAMDALDAVQGALTTMARAIAEERGLTFGTDGRSRPLRASVTAQQPELAPASTPQSAEEI